MSLVLKRIESPFVFELKNENGTTCLMDASEKIGGKNKGIRPMELLAGSLAGCASIDVINILQKKRINIGCYEVEIETKRKDELPGVFEFIHLKFLFFNTIELDKLTSIIDKVLEKYCSVAASLSSEIKLSYEIEFKK